MATFRFRLLNVFAETPLGGNPLAVFEDALGLNDATMQALALQFNLSETTFILPSSKATARVRIFTPGFEMPFAGHPTLGTAQVVRDLLKTGDALTLEMQAGIIPVSAIGERWQLAANAPTTRAPSATRAQMAAALNLSAVDISGEPLWVNTGSEQLVIPLASVDAVRRCRPDAALIEAHCHNGERAMTYVWALDEANHAEVRFFFPKNGAPCEDPGTGSACANLGGYLLARGETLPLHWTLNQGAQINKACTLTLDIDAAGQIYVGGRVVELGRGEINLPD
jgi:PhzF family phenazine biosynthesis protein